MGHSAGEEPLAARVRCTVYIHVREHSRVCSLGERNSPKWVVQSKKNSAQKIYSPEMGSRVKKITARKIMVKYLQK